MSNYLDKEGLGYFWKKIQAYYGTFDLESDSVLYPNKVKNAVESDYDIVEIDSSSSNILFKRRDTNLTPLNLDLSTLATTYSFTGGINKIIVTPYKGGAAQDPITVDIGINIPDNITGNGTADALAIFSGANTLKGTITLDSNSKTQFLRRDGTWQEPVGTTYTLSQSASNKRVLTFSSSKGDSVDITTVDTVYTQGDGISIGTNNVISNIGVLSIVPGSTAGTLTVNTAGTTEDVAIPLIPLLDSTGKIPSAYLPGSISSIVEGYYYNGKFYKDSSHTQEIEASVANIYLDLVTNKSYRYSGSVYVEIAESLALGTTPETAFPGDKGQIAYEHATDSTSKASLGIYKVAIGGKGVNGLYHVTNWEAASASDIMSLVPIASPSTLGKVKASDSGPITIGTDGTINLSTVPISLGGTGATTPADARTNLDLGTAATKNFTTTLNNTENLITSLAVYNVLEEYIHEDGGLMYGTLGFGGNFTWLADSSGAGILGIGNGNNYTRASVPYLGYQGYSLDIRTSGDNLYHYNGGEGAYYKILDNFNSSYTPTVGSGTAGASVLGTLKLGDNSYTIYGLSIDEKAKVEDYYPTASVELFPTLTTQTGVTTTLKANPTAYFDILTGTTTTEGVTSLILGNNTNKGISRNSRGQLVLYSSNIGKHIVLGTEVDTNITHTLPKNTGTILNTGTTSASAILNEGVELGRVVINNNATVFYAPKDKYVEVSSSNSKMYLLGTSDAPTTTAQRTANNNSKIYAENGALTVEKYIGALEKTLTIKVGESNNSYTYNNNPTANNVEISINPTSIGMVRITETEINNIML